MISVKGFSKETENWISWEERAFPSLPIDKGLSGAYIGIVDNQLIVAGGSYFDNDKWDGGTKIYLDSVFSLTLDSDTSTWQYRGLLPEKCAHGAAVLLKDGLVLIGGENAQGKLSSVFKLTFTAENKISFNQQLPELPYPTSHLSAALLAERIYVAGGYMVHPEGVQSSDQFLRLDLSDISSGWMKEDSWEGFSRAGASLITQTNGDHQCLYLIGGKTSDKYLNEVWEYDPLKTRNNWSKKQPLPRPLFVAASAPIGLSQIWVFSGSDGHDIDKLEILKSAYRFPMQIYSYNTITNIWYEVGTMPQGLAATSVVQYDGRLIIPGGENTPGERTPLIYSGRLAKGEMNHFHWLDYLTLFFYLGIIVLLGPYFAKRNKNTGDFFLGGRKIPFWAAGVSMMAAQVSSIGFMAIPAKSFATDWSYFAGVFTWFVAVPVTVYIFVPFYRRLNVTSAYEYLEKRFNQFVRLFIASLYLLFQLLGRLGAIIFLPSLALSAVTGIDVLLCISMIGILATAYTALGGMNAVIWIDVIQAFVLFGGVFLCIIFILFQIEGGMARFTQIAWNDHKFSLGSFDLNLTMAVFWVIIIGNIFNRISMLATDQSVVQRYLTTRNEKETAKALWTDALVSIPWALLVFGLGTALFVYYKLNPQSLDPSLSPDGIVPYFIGQNLPVGISGVIIAGIFAAAMSSVDSSIHSSTTVLMRDFFGEALDNYDESRKVRIAQFTTIGFGLLGTLIALVMSQVEITSVWDIILEVASLFTGAMTGIFVLGIFTLRASAVGASIGAVLSALLLFLVKEYTQVNFFLYSGIGMVSAFLFGWLASYFFPGTKDLKGLTFYTIEKSNHSNE